MTVVWILVVIVVALVGVGVWSDRSRRRRGISGEVNSTAGPREAPGVDDAGYGGGGI